MRTTGRRFGVGAGGAAALLALLLVVPGPAGAARRARTGQRPVVLALKAFHSGATLPASGLSVKLTARVRDATRCTFFRQAKPRTPLQAFRTVSCGHGAATVRIPRIPNPYQAQVRLTFAVQATGPGGTSARRKVRLTEAAATPQPPTASLTFGSPLPWSGGDLTLTYAATDATTCSLSSSPVLWTGSNPLPVSCNGSLTVTGIPSTPSQLQWTVTFTAQGAAGQTTLTHTLVQAAPPFSESENWSGYIVSSGSVLTEASGRFTVPTLNCADTPGGGVSVWVGIGGANETDVLLQTGVEIDCAGGVQTDDAGWWEEYPPYPEMDFDSLAVSPGDLLEASVYQQSDGSWVTRLDDLTTGISGMMISDGDYGTVLDSDPSNWLEVEGPSGVFYTGGYTAEWIVEDTGLSDGSYEPFGDYGTVTFSDLTTSLSSWGLTTGDGVGIVQSGSVLSAPSAPTSGGFSVSYTG